MKKHNLPRFLQQNQVVCMKLQSYAKEHFSGLSVELILECLLEKVLPSMVKETRRVKQRAVSQEQYIAEVKKLGTYGLACIDPSTIYQWLQKLGFRCEPRRKEYYVDGHEKPTTIEYQKNIVRHYLLYER
jgi:hypothetical protein